VNICARGGESDTSHLLRNACQQELGLVRVQAQVTG
jgi:hypothetical protein